MPCYLKYLFLGKKSLIFCPRAVTMMRRLCGTHHSTAEGHSTGPSMVALLKVAPSGTLLGLSHLGRRPGPSIVHTEASLLGKPLAVKDKELNS